MINLVDNFLNKITMYRLVLYALIGVFLGALVLSSFGLLPHNPMLLLFGVIFITTICLIFNKIFAYVFKAVANAESAYITALILTLIVAPIKDLGNFPYWIFLFWVSVWAMASKYIFAIGKKHIFNPAAFAVALTAITMNQSATWWIGTLYMLPFVLIGGLLVTRKIRRFDLALTFIAAALISIVGMRATSWDSAANTAVQAILYSPIFFFAFIMLTEPMTTPPIRKLRLAYGAIAGFLFSPFIHIGTIFSTPELALLVSNLFSYLVSPKQKLILKLKEKVQIADSTYDFIFSTEDNKKKLSYEPGQYLEWTVDPKKSDTRGNRRYFTIASSPTESELRMGVKFYPNGSTFKQKLLNMSNGDSIVASQLSGEFIMPPDKNKKLAFLAGGIGITPFRSMLKNMLDKNEKRDIVMLYSNRALKDIAYESVINEAENKLGLKNIYTVTNEFPGNVVWNGKVGFINEKMIREEIPDYKERYFYLSGTHSMVAAFDKILRGLGVPKGRIKKDFFPGYV